MIIRAPQEQAELGVMNGYTQLNAAPGSIAVTYTKMLQGNMLKPS